ncbi:MAG TPA: M23 family metallopeptidase [Candidatus Bathyarchaeia archaeon]|nr:M23 family metallopeptidase [Candidatus Bathyarchaeia archaeon]
MWKTLKMASLLFTITMAIGTCTYGQAAPVNKTTASVAVKQTTLRVQPAITYPGDVLFVRSNQATAVTLFGNTYNMRASNGEYVRFIPIPIGTKAGVYNLQTADKKTKVTIKIAAKSFATDSITVSKQMASMRQNTARINAEQVKINKARSVSAATPYFTTAFQMPVAGTLTTPYGYQRIVNGKPSSRHMAIDIANKEGTPVYASNAGKVVLAESLYLTGNTVMIDHGLSLFSSYGHMSKLDVKAGQIVKKGQLIGRVGSTGFSTGPHLHYAMLIGNTFINPNPFFTASPYQWK